ncbi:TetR/AcrR family transcriptional regulator [Caulobacter sp. CCUG 60055]|uniref:TetR/AcrR family transcriptional regulator n=1 Tax=Caulobacter sp. CCUG 60055 TaxID=2100090 RepID=UPI001FA6E84D|nr:TetR/AcrR family transcriptional regulator [Caulobacter sp. CCUG 60055]
MNAVPAFPPALGASAAKDTPKSLRTRARILDAAMALFAEIGYHAANNAKIAEAADLTRGAMLYHFPTREALVEAAVEHIQAARAALFGKAQEDLPPGADVTEHAIDVYWALLSEPAFTAFAELEFAARTDAMVRTRLGEAQAAFDRAQVGDHFLKMLHAGAGPRFQASRDLARFLLEGLHHASLTYDAEARRERLLAVIKRATHMLNRKGSVHDLWPD